MTIKTTYQSVVGSKDSKKPSISGRGQRTDPDEDEWMQEVQDKHGPLHKAIPCMPLSLAIVCCAFNVVIPGSGTFISAWACLLGCRSRLDRSLAAFGFNLLTAGLQLLTFILIVGWVWSIMWGMNFVQLARQAGRQPLMTQYYVRRQSSVNVVE